MYLWIAPSTLVCLFKVFGNHLSYSTFSSLPRNHFNQPTQGSAFKPILYCYLFYIYVSPSQCNINCWQCFFSFAHPVGRTKTDWFSGFPLFCSLLLLLLLLMMCAVTELTTMELCPFSNWPTWTIQSDRYILTTSVHKHPAPTSYSTPTPPKRPSSTYLPEWGCQRKWKVNK